MLLNYCLKFCLNFNNFFNLLKLLVLKNNLNFFIKKIVYIKNTKIFNNII